MSLCVSARCTCLFHSFTSSQLNIQPANEFKTNGSGAVRKNFLHNLCFLSAVNWERFIFQAFFSFFSLSSHLTFAIGTKMWECYVCVWCVCVCVCVIRFAWIFISVRKLSRELVCGHIHGYADTSYDHIYNKMWDWIELKNGMEK